MQNLIQEKKRYKESKREVFNIVFFYSLYSKKAKTYSQKAFGLNNKKGRSVIPFILFKKIIITYLILYFEDFYKTNSSVYFPLGGFLKKVRYRKWKRFMGRSTSKNQKLVGSDGSIGLFWYMRPSPKFYVLTSIKKLTGSTNRLPIIERKYKNRYNKDLLPIFDDEIKQKTENKTLYICGLI